MIRAIIIDDEPLARSLVKDYLRSHPDIVVVAECGDGFEGVKAIAQYKPDLLLLDIQMPKINGFEMLELLDTPPAVIFTTAFDEYALQAFERHAVDYLLKPYSQERFNKALEKWKAQRIESNRNTESLLTQHSPPDEINRIVVKKGNNIVIIPVPGIYYLEAYDDYVKIYTKDGFYLKKKTMAHYERLLTAAHFVRVHRSYLINLQELTRIEPLEKDNHIALLKAGARIPLSQSGYQKLREALGI
ncbi:MAG: response regulator [Cyclobacteriaceae bacterium]|jgi:two-component system LytT family response regulator|nr:DNA-binding response regulator [Cytophagales bacterium]HNP75830.1 response regulator [Cyclobacteriaceae bacterium]HQQ81813.1 response regulator [Cyclobacteriaceae bacterium]